MQFIKIIFVYISRVSLQNVKNKIMKLFEMYKGVSCVKCENFSVKILTFLGRLPCVQSVVLTS